MSQNEKKTPDTNDTIDLLRLFYYCCRCVRKYWYIMGGFLIVLSALTLGVYYLTFTPQYKASTEYAIDCAEDAYVNAQVTARISGSVGEITSTAEFQDQLIQVVEEQTGDTIDSNYQISSTFTENSSLMVITVTSEDAYEANQLLWGIEQVFPQWTARTIGKMEMNIVNEIPTTGGVVNRLSRRKLVVETWLVGGVLILLWLFFCFMQKKSIQTKEDMDSVTSASCMGIIPEISLKKRAKSEKMQLMIDNEHIDWAFKQSVESVRKQIENQISKDNDQTILITSTIPEEGKSITAINLAKSFKEHHKKVILVDCDFRGSGVMHMLKISDTQMGLTDYLTQKTNQAKDFIVNIDGLTIVPAGTINGNASDILNRERMQHFIKMLRKEFDVIIIDTPPSLLFGDAGVLSEYADKVFYVVRHNLADKADIVKGMELYIQSHKLAGYILNRFDEDYQHYGNYYGSYYGHYGSYGHYGRYGYGYGYGYSDTSSDAIDVTDVTLENKSSGSKE